MKGKYKMRVIFIDDEGERFLEVLDKASGHTYRYYDREFEELELKDNSQVKNYVIKRMHLIRSGAYDDVETEK